MSHDNASRTIGRTLRSGEDFECSSSHYPQNSSNNETLTPRNSTIRTLNHQIIVKSHIDRILIIVLLKTKIQLIKQLKSSKQLMSVLGCGRPPNLDWSIKFNHWCERMVMC